MRLSFPSVLLLSMSLLAVLPVYAGHKPQAVFLRIHIQTAGEGLPASQAMSVPIPPNGEVIQVRAVPEVTEKDLFDVRADPNGSVYLTLNHRGKVDLDAATGENQGKILVVILNGVVVYAPTIDEQISSGVFVIPHPLPPDLILLLQQQAKQNVEDAPPKPYKD